MLAGFFRLVRGCARLLAYLLASLLVCLLRQCPNVANSRVNLSIYMSCLHHRELQSAAAPFGPAQVFLGPTHLSLWYLLVQSSLGFLLRSAL